MDDHFHEAEDKGLFAALVPCEYIGREAAVTRLRNLQRQRANTRVELPYSRPVAVARALVVPFVALGAEVVTHLGLQSLAERRLQQSRGAVGCSRSPGTSASDRLIS